ncbi:retrovirus-related Pol polyprotein from transposon 17.6 [Labrus mixtus]|uniref:retrovirus-related Pol polyprotein from transposon 17.6 n=1 Tax=Labrus mixtus TaxID=508554 RepID=UPI0029BFACB7|nr:retrovirus-related Pol polyprotein from transposon 17.6 [Labrus mixtus]
MKPENLHCTSYVCSEGPNPEYEKRFFKDLNDNVLITDIYTNGTRCAASVKLTPAQMKLYDVYGSHPHISLSKAPTDRWRDLGPFVAQCSAANDWQPATGNLSHAEISPLLAQVPSTLWAANKYDVGLIKNCEPVQIILKLTYRPQQRQYPLRKEATEGITPVFNSLLEAGIIIPCEDSPVQTPIFPVKKIRPAGQPTEWRFVQDLQAVNSAIIAPTPNVPNPYTILSQIPSSAKWFSVVDLSNAFFSIPVQKDSQFWYAFQLGGKRYTWTRLCQGLTCSPTLFCQALSRSLSPLTLSPGSVLLQYVDDLLIAAPTKEQCETDTILLLRHLAEEGHKASLSKLQFVKQEVTFLGHILTPQGKSLSPSRVKAVAETPKPMTKKQVLSFLGMCSYCQHFIPNFSEMERPLRDIVHKRDLTASSPIQWTEEANAAFENLKLSLQSTPTLGIPDPEKPFTQFVDEKHGCMTSVLLQAHGGQLKPVGYFSRLLDPVARGLPACLRAVAACKSAVLASSDFVGYTHLDLLVPHSVASILQEQKISHLTPARWLRYHTTLLGLPNVHVKKCAVLNPATLMPLPGEGEPHSCLAELQHTCTPRPDLKDDLKDVPVPNQMVHQMSAWDLQDLPWIPPSARAQVKETLPPSADTPLHDLKPGDYVVIKNFRRKSWQHQHWLGPFQIRLTTHTAVKVAERATWTHATHCRRVPDPTTPPTDPDTSG